MDDNMIEIYFYDLSAEKQREVLEKLGDNGNYDVFPIASIPVGADEECDSSQPAVTGEPVCTCGNGIFYGHQLCRHDVRVDGNGAFISNVEIYDSEPPYGPFTCGKCGAEYSKLSDITKRN